MALAVQSAGESGRTAMLFDGETSLPAVLPASSVTDDIEAKAGRGVAAGVVDERMQFRVDRVVKVRRCFYRAGRIVVLRMEDVCALSASSANAAAVDVSECGNPGGGSASAGGEGRPGLGRESGGQKRDRLIPRVAMLRFAPCPHCRLSVAIDELEEHARGCRENLVKLIDGPRPGVETGSDAGSGLVPRSGSRSRPSSSAASSDESICQSQSQNDSQESLPLRVLQPRRHCRRVQRGRV